MQFWMISQNIGLLIGSCCQNYKRRLRKVSLHPLETIVSYVIAQGPHHLVTVFL